MGSSIKRNLGLQTAYQILNTALPLITAPYLARVLGASMLGVFSYTSSVVAYFALIAMLGTVNYGTRSIAETKNDKRAVSKTFWSIYALQFFTTAISVVAYIIYLVFFCKENYIIAIIQILTLAGCLFDINWLFFGVENFTITVTRSIVIKIVTVASIILFVKNSNDLWLYTVIMLGGTLLSQVILWFYLPRYVSFYKISVKDVLRHVQPNFLLFIPLLAMSVYHTMDKTMLGAISTYEQSGYYYNADKVINIPLCVLNGVGTVMLPRMTALFKSGQRSEADKLFVISLEGIAFVSVALGFGIAAISKEFIPMFFGSGYTPCVILTIVLSPVLLVKGFSNTVRTQYLVPLNMESVFTKSVIVGAVVNLILNFALIPKLGAMGAVIGTLVAEIIACVLQFVAIRRLVKMKTCFINTIFYMIAGVIMFFCVRTVSLLEISVALIEIAIECIIGAIVFLACCASFWKVTKNEIFTVVFGGIINKVMKRLQSAQASGH